ncbi:MAG: OadG family protein [Alkalispirochaeta sp.]
MNIESFSYVLLTTVVGMAIVFLFLAVLSVLMFVIRSIFDEKAAASGKVDGRNGGGGPGGPGDGASGGGAGSAPTNAADRTDGGVPRWAVAAALAYLSEEEREYAPRASGWTVRSIR